MNCLRVVLIIIWTLSTLLFTSTSSATTATSPTPTSAPFPSLTPVTSVGGLMHDAVVADGYAYLGEGRSLTVLDLTTPQNPTLVTRLPLPETIRSLALRETTVYALTSGRLFVIDISGPQSPRVQRSLDVGLAVGGSGEAITIHGDYAYVAAGRAGILVLDLPIADQPAIVGQLTFEDQFITNLAVQDTTAYLTYEEFPDDADEPRGGVQIVDVTTPTNPTTHYTHALPYAANHIAMYESSVYIGYRPFNAMIQVLDVRTPTAPVVRQTWQSDNVWLDALAVDATTLVMNSFDGIALADRAADGTFTVQTNLALPSFPDVLILDQPWLYAGGTGTTMDFHVLNLTNPTRPAITGAITFPGIGNQVVIDGATIYYGGGGLQILDATQPRTPQIRGTYMPNHSINDLVVQDQHIYLATNTGLEIVDARDQTNLVGLGQAATEGFAAALAVAEQTVYVAFGGGVPQSDGVRIYDVQDQNNPQERHMVPLPGPVEQMVVVDQYLYVLLAPYGANATLAVIDRQATPPAVHTTISLPERSATMAVVGDRLYVGGPALTVIQIANPATPQVEHTTELLTQLPQLASWEGHLYGMAGQQGLVHIPLVNGQPQAWRVLHDQPAWGRGFAVSDSLVGIVEWDAGLYLYQRPQTTDAVFLPLVQR